MTRPNPSASSRRSPTGRDPGTRARLLSAAAEAFADRGYRDASLRDICRRAGANNAAVNYHFRSKQGLYLEVIRECFAHVQRERPLPAHAAPPANRDEARARLREAITGFAQGILAERPRAHTLVVLREMIDPTVALDQVVEEFVRPRFKAIVEALRPLAPAASDREITFHALSVLGQVVYYRCAAPIALRLLGLERYDPALVSEIADHVVRTTERALGDLA